MLIFLQRHFQEGSSSSIGAGLGWLIIPLLLRGSVENAAKKSQSDFSLVNLETIRISISAKILEVVK